MNQEFSSSRVFQVAPRYGVQQMTKDCHNCRIKYVVPTLFLSMLTEILTKFYRIKSYDESFLFDI